MTESGSRSRLRIAILRKRLLDVGTFVAIMGVIGVFYWPKEHPLESRYVYFSATFERAAYLVNPEYDNSFQYYSQIEKALPLETLAARYATMAFPNDLGTAVLVMHLGTVGIAAMATYWLNRRYFSVLGTAMVTLLLFCGRVLLPVTRGLGHTSEHLAIPLSLALVYALDRSLRRRCRPWRRAAWVLLGGVSLAGAVFLGSHAPVFVGFCLAVGVGARSLIWAVRSVRQRRVRPWARTWGCFGATLGVAGAGVLALVAWVWCGIPGSQGPSDYWTLVRQDRILEAASTRTFRAHEQGLRQRLAVLRGTFWEGRFPPEYGLFEHGDTFLYPGAGFNGVIPLFLVPAIAVGLVSLARQGRGGRPVHLRPRRRPRRTYLLFLATLVVQFLFIAAVTDDAKPTRYGFAIYGIAALAAWGLEAIASRGRPDKAGAQTCAAARTDRSGHPNPATRPGSASRRIAVWGLLGLVALLFALRLAKNYRDFGSYRKEFAHQIPTLALRDVLAPFDSGSPGRPVRVYGGVYDIPKFVRHPSLGLRLRFRMPKGLELVNPVQDRTPPRPDSREVFLEVPDDVNLYWSARSRWPKASSERLTTREDAIRSLQTRRGARPISASGKPRGDLR